MEELTPAMGQAGPPAFFVLFSHTLTERMVFEMNNKEFIEEMKHELCIEQGRIIRLHELKAESDKLEKELTTFYQELAAGWVPLDDELIHIVEVISKAKAVNEERERLADEAEKEFIRLHDKVYSKIELDKIIPD